MFFRYNGTDISLPEIYKQNKKRRGKSRYLLSVMVDVIKDGETIPAKVVYVRNKNKRKEYLCIISTDITWIQAFQVMLQMFSKLLSNDCELSEDKITELTDAFMSTIPSALKERRKVA